jgi:hypothetical protein
VQAGLKNISFPLQPHTLTLSEQEALQQVRQAGQPHLAPFQLQAAAALPALPQALLVVLQLAATLMQMAAPAAMVLRAVAVAVAVVLHPEQAQEEMVLLQFMLMAAAAAALEAILRQAKQAVLPQQLSPQALGEFQTGTRLRQSLFLLEIMAPPLYHVALQFMAG